MRRRAEVGRRLLVVRPDRHEPPAHDHDDVGEREGHLSDRLRGRAEPEPGQHLQEEQQQRDAHHDLGRDEREQHQRVGRARAAAAPALQPERERDADRRGHEDAQHGEEQRVLERTLQRRIVEHAARLAGEPARGEPLPCGAGAAVVEGEQDGDRDRDDRPQDVRRT